MGQEPRPEHERPRVQRLLCSTARCRKVDDFLNDEAKGTQVFGTLSVEELCSVLKSPRRIMIMVKAGDVVDQTIEHVLPHLEKGDIIIDGGNSLFTDSNRRTKFGREGNLVYRDWCLGRREGARFGPSIMREAIPMRGRM